MSASSYIQSPGQFSISVRAAVLVSIALISTQLCDGQSAPKTVICDLAVAGQQERDGCTHRFVNGNAYRTISVNGIVITVKLEKYSKYLREGVRVENNSVTSIDIMPADFVLEENTPKLKTLRFVSAEKVAESTTKAAAHKNTSRKILGGFGNVFVALAGEESGHQNSTTQTSSSGTINAHSSDGVSTTGTYNGTSTSTTSSTDPAAQARAADQIRERNASTAAANGQRSAAAAAQSASMMRAALTANTLRPNQVIVGSVYFEDDEKAQIVTVTVPISSTLYKLKFDLK